MFLSLCTYFSGSFYGRYKERFMVMFDSSLGRKESSLLQRSRRRIMNKIINVKFIKTSCLSSCFNHLLFLKKRTIFVTLYFKHSDISTLLLLIIASMSEDLSYQVLLEIQLESWPLNYGLNYLSERWNWNSFHQLKWKGLHKNFDTALNGYQQVITSLKIYSEDEYNQFFWGGELLS